MPSHRHALFTAENQHTGPLAGETRVSRATTRYPELAGVFANVAWQLRGSGWTLTEVAADPDTLTPVATFSRDATDGSGTTDTGRLVLVVGKPASPACPYCTMKEKP